MMSISALWSGLESLAKSLEFCLRIQLPSPTGEPQGAFLTAEPVAPQPFLNIRQLYQGRNLHKPRPGLPPFSAFAHEPLSPRHLLCEVRRNIADRRRDEYCALRAVLTPWHAGGACKVESARFLFPSSLSFAPKMLSTEELSSLLVGWMSLGFSIWSCE